MSFDPLGWFAAAKTAIIVGSIAVTVGFGGGYYTKTKFMAASETHELKKEAHESAGNILESHSKSAGIESKVAAGNTAANSIKSAAAQRVIKQERAREEFAKEHARQTDKLDPASDAVCPPFVLDVGTVRLLNAARQGSAVESAGGSNEALNAPSSVGVSKLIDNDLEVVKLYNELATRHDALVDAVELKLKEQAE